MDSTTETRKLTEYLLRESEGTGTLPTAPVTKSELLLARLDPNSELICVFCFSALNGRRYNDTPTCSRYCHDNEYRWYRDMHAPDTTLPDPRKGREWLDLGPLR